MKLLVDAGVGRAVEERLRLLKHEVRAVRDIDPRMTDADILKLAHDEERLVVTMDKDFGELVYHTDQAHYGVLLLRMDEANGEEKARVVEAIFRQYEQDLPGRFSVYSGENLRIR